MLDPLPDSATALDAALHTLSCRSERSLVASSDTTTQRSKSFARSAGLAPPQACTVSPLGPPLSAFASLSQAVAEFHTAMPDFHVGGDPRTDH